MGLKAPNFSGLGANTITVGTLESQDATSVQINLGDDAGDDFIVDTDKLVVEGDNGNVGIGTASPGAQLEIHDTTTSSANTGGALRLSANDGAVMGDSHRLGVIEFTGAEDTSNTQTVGARIEALTEAAWTNAENGAALYFYTTDGNASQTNVLKLDSNAKATFAGAVTVSGVTTLADTALAEGAGLTMLTPLLPTTDHTSTGVSAQMLAGGTIAAFQTVCIHTVTGEVVITDADAIATMPVIGIAPAAISDTATGTILLQGFIRDDTWNWTIGGILYASTTAGAMTQTAPSGTGDFVQALGVALTADVVYFNPSLTLVEVA